MTGLVKFQPCNKTMLISPAKLQSHHAVHSSAVWIHGSSYVGVHLDAGNHQNGGRATFMVVSHRPSSTEDQVRPVGLVCGYLWWVRWDTGLFLFILCVLFHCCVYGYETPGCVGTHNFWMFIIQKKKTLFTSSQFLFSVDKRGRFYSLSGDLQSSRLLRSLDW